MLSVVFLVRMFFLSPLEAFLEVGLWGVSFTLIFLSAVRFALVILLPFFLVAVCIVQYDLDAPCESLHD